MPRASCGRSALNSRTKESKRSCCCRLLKPGGRVASFFSVRCMRSWRPFCCGWPGLMRSMAMPSRSHRWLRGERGHCSMARVPTIAEEDAKRPNRERDCLVGERTRIVNRIKSTLARLGIRNFKPTLRKAAERLASVRTPEGMPLPPNTLAELQRDMARLGFVVSQIRKIEEARQKRLEQRPETGPHAMVRLLARIVGVGVETADMLVHEVLSRPMRDR